MNSSRLAVVSLAALLTVASDGRAPAPTPLPQAGAAAHTLGINVSGHDYWTFERSFMNLTMGGSWFLVTPAAGWTPMPASRIDPTGAITSLAANESATLVMSYPQPSSSGGLFRCTWAGTGTLNVSGLSISNVAAGDHKLEFRWTLKYPAPDYAWLTLGATKAGDPLRNIDCREAGASPSQLFSTEFVDSLRPFGLIRFLDWSSANGLTDGKWSNRTLPTAMVNGPDGVAIEHMVELLNELDADGWFTLPWKAEDEYVRKFAQYVHDNMRPNRTVYVEVGNEIWNGFGGGVQAQQEGVAAKLDGDPFTARMKRYGERANQVMRIWTEVYADRPSKLVRVIGTQAVNFGVSDAALSYSDPKLIDALAVAPYFGYDLFDNGANQNAGIDDLMSQLAVKADQSIDTMKRLKAHVGKYGKRLIAYEGGQHVVSENLALVQSIERNPKMYDIYKRYIRRWHDEVGDVMTLYASTSPISKFGSWGLREYNEQPLGETPKRRAAVEAGRAEGEAAKSGQ